MGDRLKQRKAKAKKVDNTPLFKTLGFILIAVLLYYIRPWLHPILMLFYKIPFAAAFIFAVVITSVSFKREKYATGTAFLFLGVISLFILIFNSAIIGGYIVQETEYGKIDVMPDSTNINIVPEQVAMRYLEDSLQKSEEKVGKLNLVNINDKLVWMALRIPKGNIRYLTQKVSGVMVVDATKISRKTDTLTKNIKVSEGIGITDNLKWVLLKKRYLVDIGDVHYTYRNGSVLTIAPVIAYRFRFPVMIPYYDGVFVLNEAGDIGYYPLEKVEKIDLFKDNVAYPKKLAKLYAGSYKYHLGIINSLFIHKDQIKIPEVAGQYDNQPFLMHTQDDLKWVITAEPYGESYGLFKVFLVDAITGKIEVLELREDQTWTGPIKVVDYIKKKFPTIDWSSTKITEPRPYVMNSVLYWVLSVTSEDFAGISYTVFVNSWNNEVIAFETEDGVYNFIRGSAAIDTEKQTSAVKKREQLIADIEAKLKELKELVK